MKITLARRSNLTLITKENKKKPSIILIDLFASSSESIDSSLGSTYGYYAENELTKRMYKTNSIFSKVLSSESIIVHILSNLSFNDVISCMRVC